MSELSRRLVHASGALVPAAYLAGVLSWPWTVGVLLASAGVATVLEALRLFAGLEWAIYDRLTREYEQENVAGYALYTYSTAGVALLFSPPVAVAGMLMLTVGDPVSGYVSSRGVGQIKRLETLAVMFGVSLAVGSAALVVEGVPVGVALWTAAAGGVGATVADGIKPVVAGYVVDDNLSIPPAACVLMWAALWLVG